MKHRLMAGAVAAMVGAMTGSPVFASIAGDADALVPVAKRITDPYTRGLALGWLDVAAGQDREVLVSHTYDDAAPRALQDAKHFIDGSAPFTPIYSTKHWPSADRPQWTAALREIERVNERAAQSPCRGEEAGRLLALTDEAWKEQDETHGTHWVHGWQQIAHARQLARQVDRELDACSPVASTPMPEPVVLSSDTLFAFDSAALTSKGMRAIAQLAARVRPFTIQSLTVTGYTDRIGSDAYNLALSQRRAEAVARALTGAGVKARHVDTRGLGPVRPVIDCPGEPGEAVIACLAPNRRVTVAIDASATPHGGSAP